MTSTVNALLVVGGCASGVINPTLYRSRIFAHVPGVEFWWGELLGYIGADLALMVRLRHSLSNYWPMVFHHLVTLVSYGCVCVYRRAPPPRCPPSLPALRPAPRSR